MKIEGQQGYRLIFMINFIISLPVLFLFLSNYNNGSFAIFHIIFFFNTIFRMEATGYRSSRFASFVNEYICLGPALKSIDSIYGCRYIFVPSKNRVENRRFSYRSIIASTDICSRKTYSEHIVKFPIKRPILLTHA